MILIAYLRKYAAYLGCCICGRGLKLSVHEGMKDISNIKVYLKTPSGNVNFIS